MAAAAAAAAATVSAALEEEMGVYYIQEKNRNSLSKEKNYNNRSISFLGATNFPVTSSSTRCLLLLCSPFIHNFVSWKIKWYNYSLAQKTGFNANMHSCAHT